MNGIKLPRKQKKEFIKMYGRNEYLRMTGKNPYWKFTIKTLTKDMNIRINANEEQICGLVHIGNVSEKEQTITN